MSINNSRVKSSNTKYKDSSKKDFSFQKIIKDMNKKVLVSKQYRNTVKNSQLM